MLFLHKSINLFRFYTASIVSRHSEDLVYSLPCLESNGRLRLLYEQSRNNCNYCNIDCTKIAQQWCQKMMNKKRILVAVRPEDDGPVFPVLNRHFNFKVCHSLNDAITSLNEPFSSIAVVSTSTTERCSICLQQRYIILLPVPFHFSS